MRRTFYTHTHTHIHTHTHTHTHCSHQSLAKHYYYFFFFSFYLYIYCVDVFVCYPVTPCFEIKPCSPSLPPLNTGQVRDGQWCVVKIPILCLWHIHTCLFEQLNPRKSIRIFQVPFQCGFILVFTHYGFLKFFSR